MADAADPPDKHRHPPGGRRPGRSPHPWPVQRVSSAIGDLIRDAGGPKAASQLVGRSTRSLQRWARGDVQHIPAHAQGVLARASVASRNRELIQELGGVRRTAEITGRSVRTVQRWASGAITTPLADARPDAATRRRVPAGCAPRA